MAVSRTEQSFEAALEQLEGIVKELEKGDIPLEEALTSFKKGIELSQFCQKKLTDAEEVLTKIMNENDEEIIFEEREPMDE
ncbi:exodeoxyribonuclease VII small subunit [Vagococcus elongatus]|uniref:Exodeoxyribonuclease 7 small subunit n=1 Tax=Vagococcus elongatus TaxID=180344 RepID=A0A430AYC7_9ENTE|nr:exodeoxyribonuclease VII small subunit [Vagococcus elongatus]RSU13046.1 exodeoxyribonuclease VII small subunit [Vagococcus elongatus]